MSGRSYEKTNRVANRAIQLAEKVVDHPEMVGIGPTTKTAAEAFLQAHKNLLQKQQELTAADADEDKSIQELRRVYNAIRNNIDAHFSMGGTYSAASGYAVPDDLLVASRDLKVVLEEHAGVDWCQSLLKMLEPALQDAGAKASRRNEVAETIQKLRATQHTQAEEVEQLLVGFRKVVKSIFGSTSREYHSIKSNDNKGSQPGQSNDPGAVPANPAAPATPAAPADPVSGTGKGAPGQQVQPSGNPSKPEVIPVPEVKPA